MAEPAFALREHPQIIDLLAVLEQNGLTKEQEEVSSLVDYIGSMEETLSRMMGELQDMHSQVQAIQDKGISARCNRLAETAQEKVTQANTMVSAVRSNFIQAARNAVGAFKEKGRTALSQAVRAMKIPALLSKMKGVFQKTSQFMKDAASQVESKREQLHEAAGHLQNAGRVLSGKDAQEMALLEQDKGILAKVRDGFAGMGRAFSAMEERAGALAETLETEPREAAGRRSVKSELHTLKAKQGGKRLIAPAKEQAR